ncbi:MAG: endoribonuclease MazF [Ilumatobacteraceae bacterium]|jgi:mRNA interferase MazF|nr:endoribonuclease MazF [Ilumatobacteraceae bacterium]
MATHNDVPDAGDVVWLAFDPQAGHEQAGHRPALVISPASYNGKTGLMICCPITTQIKGYPFEVVTQVDGVACAVLSDQVKSLDWKVRRAKKKSVASADVLVLVRAKIKALLMMT